MCTTLHATCRMHYCTRLRINLQYYVIFLLEGFFLLDRLNQVDCSPTINLSVCLGLIRSAYCIFMLHCPTVQQPWLRDYVLFNANLRSHAKNDLEKNLHKFFVNSIFGKSMEQVRNRETVHIISNIRQLRYYVTQATFKSFEILNKNLVIIFMKRPVVR
jgi:hypothetical protein